MTEPRNFDCNHGIPPEFKPEIYVGITKILRCSAYLLSTEQQCQSMVKNGSQYCGWHNQPLVTRACGICKRKRQVDAIIQRERRKAERLKRQKRARPGKPIDSYRLTDSEKKQIENQRDSRRAYDAQLREAVSMLDEHLSNSAGKEFDRGLKLAVDGEVQAGLDIMREAREKMNAESFDDSAMLALLEKPRYLLESDGVVSMGTVLDVMSEYIAMALRVIPSDSGRAWFIGKIRAKFGSSIHH